MTWQILCISTAFRSNGTRLSQAQLISARIIWVWVATVAVFIFRKQLKISKVQNALARYQWALWALTILQANKSPQKDIEEALDILQWLSDDLKKIDK